MGGEQEACASEALRRATPLTHGDPDERTSTQTQLTQTLTGLIVKPWQRREDRDRGECIVGPRTRTLTVEGNNHAIKKGLACCFKAGKPPFCDLTTLEKDDAIRLFIIYFYVMRFCNTVTWKS